MYNTDRITGAKTFYIESYGCTYNKGDTQKIESVLDSRGLIRVNNPDKADIIIINTCGVKLQTQEKIISRIGNFRLRKNQYMIVTGCLPWIDKSILKRILNANNKIFAVTDFNSIIDGSIFKINSTPPVVLRSPRKFDKTGILPIIHKQQITGIVQIAEGCNGSCTYCATKFSRGKAFSYNVRNIVRLIEHYLESGVKEIFLTAQDLGVYNFNGLDLLGLLKIISDKFSGKRFFIRLGMINPGYLIDFLDDIIRILHSSNIFYKFLHIPIQSASQSVLLNMQRSYSVKDIHKIFEKLRDTDITVSTDIICGFPGESEEDFMETYKFIEKYRPDIINISKYTVRPRTRAAQMSQLPSETIKERSARLTLLYKSYQQSNSLRFLGWEGPVLILKNIKQKTYPSFGRNIYYKPVYIQKFLEKGIFVNVKIVDIAGHGLVGNLLS